MTSPFFIGPNAPERNPTPVPQYFSPSVYFIVAIALGVTTLVTTAANHNYVIGQLVRLHIPPTYGTRQLNEQQGYVLNIPSPTEVYISINSQEFDPFISSPAYGPTKPQICGTGDINTGVASNPYGRVLEGTTIPGAFINTSPIEGTWLS